MKRTIRMNGGNEICRSVEKSLDEYFRKLDGEPPHGIYDMVIANVERSLIISIMHRAGGNQTNAADMLGLESQHPALEAVEVQHPLKSRLGPTSQCRGRSPDTRLLSVAPPITQALLSVSDKTGLTDFARGLAALGVKLLSTGGTAKALADAGLPVTEIASYTGFPEMLDGRVKTLHPKVHGGILARRDLPAHVEALRGHDIPTIDLVVVNLYPFRETVAKPGCTLDDAIENIDIGGPAMVRSAAKNHAHVGVVVDPVDYPALLDELRAHGAALSSATRFALAQKAFSHTAAYDGAISNYLTSRDAAGAVYALPSRFNWQGTKLQDMRYGENPHQQAAFYRDEVPAPGTIATARQLQGKELSYNNIADSDAAWECVQVFPEPACVIVKHANPCGVALAVTPLEAYRKAFATDPTSAFGGIIAFNREVDASVVEAVSAQFLEVLIAPSYSADALAAIAKKANVRVLAIAGAAQGQRMGQQARRRRHAGADRRCRHHRCAIAQGRHSRRTHTGSGRRPAVCLARREIRQIECDRLLWRRAHAGNRRGPDESRRFNPHRCDQSGQRWIVAGGVGRRFRCILSVPRRARRGRGQRRGCRHPARGQRPRPRGDRRRGRARHCHGLHRRSTFPSLI